MFVWIFHRVSGFALIFIFAFQIFTGFFQVSSSNAELTKEIAGLHKHQYLNFIMVFLFIFHGLYGIRTILMDLGVKKEKLLFWTANLIGSAIFIGFIILFSKYVAK